MRDIKFRAWDKEKKRLFSVTEIQFSPEWRVHRSDVSFKYKRFPHSHNDYVLMQCTGLKDKNGKEIYEGDIVRREDKGTYVVRWEKKCAGFIMGISSHDWQWIKEDYTPIYKVLGNIYENPELLEDING